MRIFGGMQRLSRCNLLFQTLFALLMFVPVPILSRGFCLSSKVMSSWASGGGASSPSGQLISSGNTQMHHDKSKLFSRHPLKMILILILFLHLDLVSDLAHKYIEHFWTTELTRFIVQYTTCEVYSDVDVKLKWNYHTIVFSCLYHFF